MQTPLRTVQGFCTPQDSLNLSLAFKAVCRHPQSCHLLLPSLMHLSPVCLLCHKQVTLLRRGQWPGPATLPFHRRGPLPRGSSLPPDPSGSSQGGPGTTLNSQAPGLLGGLILCGQWVAEWLKMQALNGGAGSVLASPLTSWEPSGRPL